jgi:hypothetical protein
MKRAGGSESSGGFEKSHVDLAGPSARLTRPRVMSADLREFIEQTRTDAVAANDCIVSLLELLHGCPPDHQVSARGLAALLALVQAYLANVVDGMREEVITG